MIKTIKNKIGGWGNFSLLILLLGIFMFAFLKKYYLKSKPLYVKGVSEGISKSVRGNQILDYHFEVNGRIYKGFVPSSFCKKCFCCNIGDTVIVRYEDGNPENNDLVLKVP